MSAPRPLLIVNADDFGLTESVNRGIIEAHDAGAVTSTSLMVNMPGWEDALDRLRPRRAVLGVGLHLNLIAGRPLTRAPSLTDSSTGDFHSFRSLAWRSACGLVRLVEVQAECAAQLSRMVMARVRVTHVDSHRHTHCFPGFFSAVRNAAALVGVRVIRVPREPMAAGPQRADVRLKKRLLDAGVWASGARRDDVRAEFFGVSLQNSPAFLEGVLARLDALPAGPSELAVHPGYASPELAALDGYTDVRERELRALTSPELLARLARGDIARGHFGML